MTAKIPAHSDSQGTTIQVPKIPSLPKFEIYHSDCLEILRTLPDNVADAIIMDPPYPNRTPLGGKTARAKALQAANTFGDLNINGLEWLLRAIALESKRLVKPTGSMLVFCDSSMHIQIVPAIQSCGPRYEDVIVWDKDQFGRGSGFRKQHELIAHFTFDKPMYHDHSIPNVIQCKRVSKRLHPNQKPLQLLKYLIQVVCPEGGTVLDPFMGTGSTGQVCLWTQRNFIGVELNRQYFELADKLLGALQARLCAQLGSR